ncbi:MAG: conserved protein of unknown function [Nitrospira sp.]
MLTTHEQPLHECNVLPEPQWFALKTHSRHEKQVRDRLSAIGVEPLLPLTKSLRRWTDRKVWTVLPLFSGYCFARFSLANRLAILQTPGVVRIVGCLNPEPIPQEELAAIQKLCTSQRHAESCEYFIEGTWVRVVRGPLAGLRGQMVRKGSHNCLIIRAHLIQQAALVHIDTDEVVLDTPAGELSFA